MLFLPLCSGGFFALVSAVSTNFKTKRDLMIRVNVVCIFVFVDGIGLKRNYYFLFTVLCRLNEVLNVVVLLGWESATFAMVSDVSTNLIKWNGHKTS